MSTFEIKISNPVPVLTIYSYYVGSELVACQSFSEGKQISINAITGTFGNDFITI